MLETVNVWRLVAHHQDPERAIQWSRRHERIAIGWDDIGDIEQQGYQSAAEIGAAIRTAYPGISNSGLGGPSLWNFYAEVQRGDLVILSSGKGRVAVFEVEGEYEYVLSNDPPHWYPYRHQRRARVRSIDPERLWRAAGARPAPGQNTRWTLFRCDKPVPEADL